MTKEEYLANQDVESFIAWMAEMTGSGARLDHSWRRPGADGIVSFSCLADALEQYEWRFRFTDPRPDAKPGSICAGTTYGDSAEKLDMLGALLRSAVEAGSDDDARKYATAVLEWGGVTAHNSAWLVRNTQGLAAHLSSVRDLLARNIDDRQVFPQNLRFNAGMTKIYSQLVNGFIIYDSRVAASLAWLVLKWCRATGAASVPPVLAFPCMPPKEGDNPEIRKVRNPGHGNFRFPYMRNRARLHAQWNLRASWIISAVLARAANTPFHARKDASRALEAALFMWGYDLSRSIEGHGAIDEEPVQTEAGDAPANWHPLLTRGRKLPFSWAFLPGEQIVAIRASTESETITDRFSVTEIFLLLHILYDQFGEDWIPLRNSVTELPAPGRRPGLGSAIAELVSSLRVNENGVVLNNEPTRAEVIHAHAASNLGPVLESTGLFEWNNRQKGICWRFRTAPPPAISDLRDFLAGFADLTDE